MVANMISDINGRTQLEGVSEQGRGKYPNF
jgi:hypothetical protein